MSAFLVDQLSREAAVGIITRKQSEKAERKREDGVCHHSRYMLFWSSAVCRSDVEKGPYSALPIQPLPGKTSTDSEAKQRKNQMWKGAERSLSFTRAVRCLLVYFQSTPLLLK